MIFNSYQWMFNNIIILFLEIGTVTPHVETGIDVVHYLQHTLTRQK